MAINLYTPAEVAVHLAERVRQTRLIRGWTQTELARRAGVALSTLKLFEHEGQISLDRLLRIATALDNLDSFQTLFNAPRARSLDEIEKRASRIRRKRGRSSHPEVPRTKLRKAEAHPQIPADSFGLSRER